MNYSQAMNVSVIGTGYVGLITGVCLSKLGHSVTCIDIDEEKVALLGKGCTTMHEPRIKELLEEGLSSKKLRFSTNFSSINGSGVIFLAVGTPTLESGDPDLGFVHKAAEAVVGQARDGATVVVKSTVPPGTAGFLRKFVAKKKKKRLAIVSNPEFLREGSAVQDFMEPDRIIIGCREKASISLMANIYAPMIRGGSRLLVMDHVSAELTKYAANCLLASRVSFINEIASLCELVGANIDDIRTALGSDRRIGPSFLSPGPGFGGSCLPKDVSALIAIARAHGMELRVIKAVQRANVEQRHRILDKVRRHYGNLARRTLAIWGTAFKAGTDDTRESPALHLVASLLEEGAAISCHDPAAKNNFLKEMARKGVELARIATFEDKYACLKGADGLIIMTEWKEFVSADLAKVKRLLGGTVVFDARNVLDPAKVLATGLDYHAIGRTRRDRPKPESKSSHLLENFPANTW